MPLKNPYKKYQKYFWNTTIQENIKSAKEEQYQATFLNELFVNILGYTLFPNPNSNLTTEFKNEKNARKADGAILNNGSAIAVIELKGTNTKDLESIRRQAFDYKANNKGCVYVITSNFEKLRFYINDATEFEEFNLFTLTLDQFKLMYYCLSVEQIMTNTPLHAKEASIVEEEEITKAFYKDYSVFKRELYRDLVKRNSKTVKSKLSNTSPTEDSNDLQRLEKNVKLTVFQKSQKLIDRFLFIFFAEDRMLLPSNSTIQILNKWKDDIEFGDDRPLYDLFKQYFRFLDTGRKGTTNRAEIYAYNGGLFKPDAILDALEIDSELLYKHTLQLSKYDFESQVDVNILGHIFENSLNEIESVNAEIEGDTFDKQTSKRKKDGVFYTPKYITKYIVENTVGKLCHEKKTELGFKEEEYFKGRKNRNKTTIEKLVNILDDYRDWLLQLTICDPACGSGAFLNQALDFLIKEHNYIDELKVKVLGGGLQFPDIENTILENNIYGVDLNEESVEIAKLSLWLRTAQPRRKLNDLSSNIKCGNSLIDVKAVAGEKAFKWEDKFPEIFAKGGFDAIIGNPPYVQTSIPDNHKEYLEKKYRGSQGKPDLYRFFIEKGIGLINSKGYFSFITPNSFLSIPSAQKLRQLIKNEAFLTEIINFSGMVFKDASINTVIFILNKASKTDSLRIINDESSVPSGQSLIDAKLNSVNRKYSSYLESDIISIESDLAVFDALEKIKSAQYVLNEVGKYTLGMQVYHNTMHTKEDIKNRVYHSFDKNNDSFIPEVGGNNLDTYILNLDFKEYVSYGDWCYNKPDLDMINGERILLREIPGRSRLKAVIINEMAVPNKAVIIIKAEILTNNELLGILNSKLMGFYVHKSTEKGKQKLFPRISLTTVKNLPIYKPKTPQLNLSVEKVLSTSTKYEERRIRFLKYIKSASTIDKFSRKLQSWHELTFAEFSKELNKAINSDNRQRRKDGVEELPQLTKKDEFEWMELFEENKTKAVALQQQITQTEKEIDQMVYELYGLTDEEIAIVENS
ncbi:Eco57I restriction-modification methylase domain-containing protein [Croceibacter atlanticus]|uniref:Eco57I restriction-modification methylase domain-containing protein n=1 Tax=Croceibacter atlanticus TaxID=313588 RepID=UPI0030F725B1